MADPATMGVIGIGSSVMGGLTKAAGAKTNAQAQQLNIQGQMLQTIGAAFGQRVQAEQYLYEADINKYQSAVSLINRDIAKQNAAYSREVGEVEAQQVGMKAAAERGEMTAFQGASGLSVSGGSATRVREGMIEIGYYDQMQTRASAAKKAYGYEVEAAMHEAQSEVYRFTATENEFQSKMALTAANMTEQALPLQQQAMGIAQKAGDIGVMGSLVGAAGSVADKWVQGKGFGLFD